ncbi:LysM peptidoglycan-binding domain-containing protein [Xylocopilactobacillus apis]|uniref:Peptidoglycan hydrolase n=1 Tax=Xylocopilactobacillus apis TaxID=2932183 RepID=A0AAU9DDZ2_9LACO|nr:LysM peptidoglycan-binding domain-containing protein [Xylocopilactobacillus apis]BDR56386.1 autolysin [Xylocopilactobacillus apis]
METRKERINAQIERNKRYQRKCKARKFGKISLFTGTSLGLAGIFANSVTTKAVSSKVQIQQNNNGTVSNPAPNSNYNFSQGLNQVTYLSQSQYDFLSKIAPSAQKIASENNLYASIMIAQAIIESGWGQSGLASAPNYNLFGVKGSYMGDSVSMPTYEQTPDGASYSIVAGFAKYPSYEDSMKGYVQTMLNPLYVGAWRSTTNNYQEAARYLTGRYATAINYGDTLISMIQKYNLSVFDSKEFSVDPALKGMKVSTQKQTYKIQKGDSLWGISRKFNVKLDSLLKLNNLKLDSKIFPNQVITIKEVDKVNIPNVQIVSSPVSDSTNKPSLPLSTNSSTNSNLSKNSDYVVQKGDSLYRIALKNGISLEQLLKINNLKADSPIKPGQLLKITANIITPNKPVASNSSANHDVKGNTYTVQKGDNLYQIARKVGISLDELLKLNNLKANSVIMVGQKLNIQKGINKAPSVSKSSTFYTVQKGDTLYSIANKTKTNLNELLSLNNLKLNSVITPGQKIIIKQNAPAPVTPNKNQGNHENTSVYVVKQGDNLYKIAKSNGISLDELLKLNNLKENSVIVAGQKLIIKGNVENIKNNKEEKTDISKDTAYTVQKGDSLYGIAQKSGVTVEVLLNLNNLKENSVIVPGQKLIIKGSSENRNSDKQPQSSETKSDVQNKDSVNPDPINKSNNDEKTVAPAGQKTYTVKQGDSLYKIATANKTTVNILEKLNNLPGGVILPGQIIKIP